MPEKTFDKADLLKFFDESGHEAVVGKLTVVSPVKGLFDETTTDRYPVAAETMALWCDKYGFAVLTQRVNCDGLHHLPKSHVLRTERPLYFRHGAGASSAALMRWAAELADGWRGLVRAIVGDMGVIDLTMPTQVEGAYTVTDAGAYTFPDAPAPTDDNTPTDTTIDDVLDGDGDE